MAFKDYPLAPDDVEIIGDATYVGPNMARNDVRPALQQLASDGRGLYDYVSGLYQAAFGPTYTTVAAGIAATAAGKLFLAKDGDGITTLYLNDSGTAVLQQSLATLQTLAALSGSSLIGHLDDGEGAPPTTLAAWLNAIQQYLSGHFYAENGAKINRMADRLFLGDASKSEGMNTTEQGDWLTDFQLSKGRANGLMQSTQMGVSTSGLDASLALLCGARTSSLYANYNAVGIVGIAVADRTSGNGHAYGAYFEGYREAGSTGGAYGIEVDTINTASAELIDPYQQNPLQTIAIQVAGGGEYPAEGQFEASAAFNVRNNGATFRKGLVFGSDAISGADGDAGTGIAIALGKGHGVVWYSGEDTSTSGIYSTAINPANSTLLNLNENSVQFNNAQSNKTIFGIVNSGAATVNYPKVQPANAGAPVQYMADGDDAAIGVRIVPKGTGGAATVQVPIANVPEHADDAAAQAASVPIGGFYRTGSSLKIRAA